MSWLLTPAESDFRQTMPLPDRRAGMLGLLLAFGIGAALAIILKRPFEGQLPSVAILGLLEILLVFALFKSAWRWLRRVKGTTSAKAPETQEIQAYTRQLLREHDAYRAVFNALAAGSTLDSVLSTIADAAETIIPGCACCFLEKTGPNGDLRIAPRERSPAARRCFTPTLSPHNVEVFGRLSAELPEVVIPEAQIAFDEPTSTQLQARQLTSCHLLAILLGDGRSWGILALWYPAESRETVRNEASVVAQLATAAIERMLLVRRLQDQTERMLLAEKAGKIGTWDWNLKTDRVIWSEQMEELFLMSPGTFGGQYKEWRQFIVPEDLVHVEEVIQQSLGEKSQNYYGVYRVRLSDEKVHWMESYGALYYDEQGNPVRMVGTCSDITVKKELLEKTEESRRRLELVLDAANLGFWDWHIPSGQGQFSGSWASMLGYSLDEIAPSVSSWEKLVHPDDISQVVKALNSHLSGETEVYESEHRLRKKDGSWLWVLDRGKVIGRDAQGKPIRALGIHADVSEQHAAQEALRIAAKRKDEFLATLAHELRNPLAPLRTGLQILKRASSSDDSQNARDMMERQLLVMVRLIDDLLDVARIKQGRIDLKKTTMHLQDAVRTGIEGAKPLVDEAQLTFSVDMPDTPILVTGDAVRLAQVVNNLISNAAKYTPRGGAIHLQLSRSNGTAELRVGDTGLGIPQEMLESIFDMFGQVNQTLDRSQGGLGIGLAITRKLVELHGGDVRATSDGIGKGSTFTVHLPAQPAAQSAESAAPQRSGAEAAVRAEKSAKRVLVVDDNVDGAESLALFINMLGHTVETANSGPQALSTIRSQMPDVVFLDIGLPGMTGYDVARAIRQMPNGESLTLVALTGWGTEEDKHKAKEAGFSEHLTKPVDMADIERILSHAAAASPTISVHLPPTQSGGAAAPLP